MFEQGVKDLGDMGDVFGIRIYKDVIYVNDISWNTLFIKD